MAENMERPSCSKCDMRISMWNWWGENVDITWVHQSECPRYQGLQRPKTGVLKDTADIEALPPGTVYRTANDQVGRIFATEFGKFVQWMGMTLVDELPRDNAYPLPPTHFPGEVIWRPS